MLTRQAEQAALFRSLHRDGVLVLPNAWDAVSAAVISADGQEMSRQAMAAAVSVIVRTVSVPLTDLEAIAALAAGPLPLNVMAGPGAPSVSELAAAELLASGTYQCLASAIAYSRLNSLLAAR